MKYTADDDSSASEQLCEVNHFSILCNVRQHLAKWQRYCQNHKIKALKEYEHFCIGVKIHGNRTIVKIECKLCGKKRTLALKNGKAMISNWTRHITSCVEVPKQNGTTTLNKYFTTPSPVASSSSGVFSPSPEFSPSTSESTNSELNVEASISEFSNSHFRYPPSVNAHDTQEWDLDLVKVRTDWCHATRERLKLLESTPLQYNTKHTALQVLHVDKCHWAAL